MDTEAKNIAVRKSVTVNAPIDHVFRTFTAGHNEWWPRAHHIGTSEPFTAIIEPRVGGRWYERGDDGGECDWGRVLVWEEPTRIVLMWCVGADWRYDPQLRTEVEVRFTAESARRTRVELEHRHLERFGDKAEQMREIFESPDAWAGTLAAMVDCAERTRSDS